MKKTILLNNFTSYQSNENYQAIKKHTSEVVNYIINNDIIDKSKISISSEFINYFNIASDLVFIAPIQKKWQALSNNQKRKTIASAILYALKRDYAFDRSMSVYDKITKCYIKKEYAEKTSVKINELFYQVAMTLNGDKYQA